jgi:hypothetical protein
MPQTTGEAQKSLLIWLSKKAAEELKALLETRHLYQKIDIDPGKVAKALHNQIVIIHQKSFGEWLSNELPGKRFALEPHFSILAKLAGQSTAGVPLILPHVSIFCKNCERREAFAPIWHSELISEIRTSISSGLSKPIALDEDFQIFSLVYQCQRCLGTPESFLVRREGWTLSLQGRSPMERVEVPSYIPRIESKFYRDAVIAFNSGKTLAGLFYLRTFIEQFGRRITGIAGKATGDEIFDVYYKTLSLKLADQMPSLREWYDKLSDPIHSAREDTALFESARVEIERHFDFRRIYKINDPEPADGSKTEKKSA